ncbi:MAG: WYL domain-containing protein [Lactobacillus sp.]|jgi:predicted DNA-binding transcriptional regulator YafY|nr:WYL domain-containing protein [Lactobacillus sp.]
MTSLTAKRLLPVYLLMILWQDSDEDHPLKQTELVQLLQDRFALTVDRKTIQRNLTDLLGLDIGIEYGSKTRTVRPKSGEVYDSDVLTDVYLSHAFTDGELRLLIDSVLFSKSIPSHQGDQLIAKMAHLASKYFSMRTQYVLRIDDQRPENTNLFYTIEVLHEAIAQQKKVVFFYNSYGTDKQMHRRRDANGKVRSYTVNPYQMAIANGRYYLICSNDKYDNLANYRLDRMTDIKLSSEKARIIPEVRGLDMAKHLREHLYMFAGPSLRVTFRAKKMLLDDIIDWFGNDVTFKAKDEQTVTAEVYVNETSMQLWALQYAPYVTVLKPKSLVQNIKAGLTQALKQYDQ